MGPLRGGQQLESVLAELADGRQVDRAEAGEPAPEQGLQRHPENCEDRDAQQCLAVKRPGPGGPLSVTAQLIDGVPAATDDRRRVRQQLLSAQQPTLLNPTARHAPKLTSATLFPRVSADHGIPVLRTVGGLPRRWRGSQAVASNH